MPRNLPPTRLSHRPVYSVFRGEPAITNELGLVPKDVRALVRPAALSAAERECYSPHAMRHAAAVLAELGAQEYCREHAMPVGPKAFVQCLLDHSEIDGDPYGYLGVSDERGRERYSALAAQFNWDRLTTDAGARKTIDVKALRRSLQARSAGQGELERAVARLAALSGETSKAISKAQRNPTSGQLLSLMTKQGETYALMEEERRLREEIRSLDAEIRALKFDPLRRIAVPDDVADSEICTDPEALEAEEEGTFYVLGRSMQRVRDWLTITELALVAGVTGATARRWAAGLATPFAERDPRNPWRPGAPPVQTLGPRKRVVRVADLNPGFLAAAGRADRLTQVLSRYPEGWAAATIDVVSRALAGEVVR
jgi:hypothetical protein